MTSNVRCAGNFSGSILPVIDANGYSSQEASCMRRRAIEDKYGSPDTREHTTSCSCRDKKSVSTCPKTNPQSDNIPYTIGSAFFHS